MALTKQAVRNYVLNFYFTSDFRYPETLRRTKELLEIKNCIFKGTLLICAIDWMFKIPKG
jgi:hypothetical protein